MSQNPPPVPPGLFAPQNLLDKMIAYVAPKTAIRRMQARGALALAGGYSGAKIDRAALTSWRTTAGSPETDVIQDLPMLRQRSRDLERNAPVACGVINTTATHTVGTGLSCNPQIDGAFLGLSDEEREAWQTDTRRRFRTWSESVDCDLARKLNFYGLQDLALRGTMVSGDIFALTPMVPRGVGGRKKLAVQLLEADYCSNPDREADTETRTEGIDHDPGTGEALAFHFTNRHPGDNVVDLTWTRREARSPSGRRNVLHLYRMLRPNLRRGVPILAPVIEPLKQLARYTESELAAAVTSSLFSVFVRMDPKAFADMFDTDAQKVLVDASVKNASKWSGEMEGGQVVNLLPGEEPIEINPARPNEQFDPFVTSCIRQIGMAIGIPYEVLIMHYQSSYSAARGALLMAWKYFIGWRDWLATYFCQPIYELWLADEVANRRIAAPGFFSDEVRRAAWCKAQWVGDGPGSINPEVEVKAAEGRVALGISTLEAESILHDGVDWQTKHPQTVREAKARRDAGLSVPGEVPKPAAPAGGPPKPKPADD
jgi:lambda family phage portal protein